MMRSLSSAVGGLRSHQTRMDVIGNNIANVNTYGFKSSRVTFSDVYYQTTSNGNGNNGIMGGTNPTQIGYGAAVATIDVLNAATGQTSTGRNLDMYITGDGMIAVQDSSGNMKYTRLGALYFDDEGFLVDGNGNFVMGSAAVQADGSIRVDDLVKIQYDTDQEWSDIGINSSGEIIGQLQGDSSARLTSGLPNWIRNITIPENSNITGGIKMAMEYRYTPNTTTPGTWITDVQAYNNSNLSGTYTITHDNGVITAKNADGDTLTGDYIRGGDVVMYRNGVAVATITTDAYTNVVTAGGSVTFNEQRYLTFEGTDIGGNKLEYEAAYNNQSSITLGEGTTQVTVQIDPSRVDYADVFTLSTAVLNNSANAAGNYVNSIYMSDDYARAGDITLWAGVEQTATLSTSSTDYKSYLNFMDSDFLKAWMEAYAEGEELTGSVNYAVEMQRSTAGVYSVRIVDKDNGKQILTGTVGASTPGGTLDQITFTPGSGWPATGTEPTTGNPAAAWRIMTITDPAGFQNNDDAMSDSAWVSYDLGSTDSSNVIQVRDATGDTILGSVVYTSTTGGTVNVGDYFTLDINNSMFNALFTGTTYNALDKIGTTIGTVSSSSQAQWEYNGTAATAETATGDTVTIGTIALAAFNNMAGMKQDGTSYFLKSSNSGDPSYYKAGTGNVGDIATGYLESSNVDLSSEFTDMITTQRGFQANSRIITVSDEMLQELVNLKR